MIKNLTFTLSCLLVCWFVIGCGTQRRRVNPSKELDIVRLHRDINDIYDFQTIELIYGAASVKGGCGELGFATTYRRTDYKNWDFLTLWLGTKRSYEVWYVVFRDLQFKTPEPIEVYASLPTEELPGSYLTAYAAVRRECRKIWPEGSRNGGGTE